MRTHTHTQRAQTQRARTQRAHAQGAHIQRTHRQRVHTRRTHIHTQRARHQRDTHNVRDCVRYKRVPPGKLKNQCFFGWSFFIFLHFYFIVLNSFKFVLNVLIFFSIFYLHVFLSISKIISRSCGKIELKIISLLFLG